MKGMSTGLVEMKMKLATIKIMKALLRKANADLRAYARWRGPERNRTEDNYIQTNPLLYLNLPSTPGKLLCRIDARKCLSLFQLRLSYEEVDGGAVALD